MRLKPFCILVVVGAALIFTPTSSAHAILVSSTPNLNAVLSGPGMAVKLRFNSRIDASRSRLILVDPDGKQRPLIINKTSPSDSLLSEVKDLKPGAYILRWQALAEDGHITRGEVPFRIR
jgi:methionine-rich copper-binding protein CopC